MELRPETEEAPGVPIRFAAVHDDGTQLATLLVTTTGAGPDVTVTVPAPLLVRRAEARGIVETLEQLPGVPGGPLTVDVGDELIRYEARCAGYGGALRAPLTLGAGTAGSGPADADALVAQVGALLAATVTRRRTLTRRAVDLQVLPADGIDPVRLRVPRRGNVMPETVAASVDTMLGVKRRFGRDATGIWKLVFDPDGVNFASGNVVGSAEGGAGVIVLNPVLVAADALGAQRSRMAKEGVTAGSSAAVPSPYFPVDGVTAHECWHYLDAAVLSSGARYTEFNRELGVALGVESLELALRGRERDAPPEWRAGFVRLVQEVSPYAATNPREATAEMFKLWWCRTAPPSPVVAAFGALVDRFLPASPRG